MDYKELIERLKCPRVRECPYDYIKSCKECQKELYGDATAAITDLLSRAEVAEAKAEKAETERDAALQQLEIKLKEQMFANYINPYPPMIPQKEE